MKTRDDLAIPMSNGWAKNLWVAVLIDFLTGILNMVPRVLLVGQRKA